MRLAPPSLFFKSYIYRISLLEIFEYNSVMNKLLFSIMLIVPDQVGLPVYCVPTKYEDRALGWENGVCSLRNHSYSYYCLQY